MRVHLEFGCITDHQALESTCLFIETRQPHQFSFDFFPVRKRIEQKAVIAIDGRYQLPCATLRNALAIPGRYCKPPFGIERDFGRPSKHVFVDGCWIRT